MQSVLYSHRGIIDIAVDLDDPSPVADVCRVSAGQGPFSAATLAVEPAAANDPAETLRFGFVEPTGASLTDDVVLESGGYAVLGLDRASLGMLVEAALAEPDLKAGEIHARARLRRSIGARPEVAGLAVHITVTRRPSLPLVAVASQRLTLVTDAGPAPVRIALLDLVFGPDVALAAPGTDLLLRLEVPSAVAGLQVSLETSGRGVSLQGDSLRPTDPGTGVHEATLRLESPSALAAGPVRLLVSAEGGSLLALTSDPRHDGATLATRRLPIAVGASWADRPAPGGPVSRPVMAECLIETDEAAWLSLSIGDLPVRLEPDAATSAVRLAPLALVAKADRDTGRLRLAASRRMAVLSLHNMPFTHGVGLGVCLLDAAGTVLWQGRHACALRKDGPVARAELPLDSLLDIPQLLEGLVAGGCDSSTFALRLIPEISGAGGAHPVAEVPLTVFADVEAWPVCIDFGASAIGIWVRATGRGTPDQAAGISAFEALPLGAWHGRIDEAHDEGVVGTDGRSGTLIPSSVGLSSRESLCGMHAPARLGDLSLAFAAPDAVDRRLARLNRRYDVSLPFPDTAALHDHLGTVVLDLKRLLTSDVDSIDLVQPIRERSDGVGRETRRVDVADLFADSVDELLSLYVSRRFAEAVDPDNGRTPLQPRLVMTHPCGIGREQIERYRRTLAHRLATRRPYAATRAEDVALYPEAVAAARFAQSEEGYGAAVGRSGATVVALDIGAGTVDVAILGDAAAGGANRLLTQFGLPLGGSDLDRGLETHILALLAKTLGNLTPSPFTMALDGTPTGSATAAARRLEVWFARQIRLAKARLTDRLLSSSSSGTKGEGAYRWTDQGKSGPTLDILLYDATQATGILSPPKERRPDPSRSEDVALVLADQCIGWLVTEQPESAGPSAPPKRVHVRLLPAAFAPAAMADAGALPGFEPVLAALGEVLPRIALTEARRLTPEAPITLLVTGRTALWPALYERITKTVAALGLDVQMPAQPLPPAAMKRAVVAGALLLADELRFAPVEPMHPNPLAAVTLRRRPDRGGRADRIAIASQVTAIHYFVEPDTPIPPGFTHLVRAMPGLDGASLAALAEAMPEGLPVLELRDAGGLPFVGLGIADPARVRVRRNVDATVVDVESADGGVAANLTIMGDRVVVVRRRGAAYPLGSGAV